MTPTPSTESTAVIAAECIAVRIRMLNRAISKLYDEALRPLELKISQMNILVAVARVGTARPADICKRLHLSVSTLSRNVDRMKSRGWLEVLTEEDGRTQPFRLTPRGHELLDAAAPRWRAAQEQALDLLGPGGLDLVKTATRRLNSMHG